MGNSAKAILDLELTLEDGLVERAFAAQSCELALSTTAMMIAVALDPTEIQAGISAGEWAENEPEPESPPIEPPAQPPELESEPELEPELELLLLLRPSPRAPLFANRV